MVKFQHRFLVRAALERVAHFHAQSDSMRAITPPPIIVQMHAAPPELSEGDEMEFSLWFGPLPVRWKARIEQVSPTGFVDRQIEGPFKTWEHKHRFIPRGESATEVSDEIELTIRREPIWALLGIAMRISLPFLFAYRGWKTKRLLEVN